MIHQKARALCRYLAGLTHLRAMQRKQFAPTLRRYCDAIGKISIYAIGDLVVIGGRDAETAMLATGSHDRARRAKIRNKSKDRRRSEGS